MAKKIARSDAEIALVKAHVLDLMESGTVCTRAAKGMGLSVRTVWDWRKADPAFDQAFKTAQALCTEVMADNIPHLHEEIDDPKLAMVASKNLQWYVERRNPETFGPKVQASTEQPQLITILQAAVNRLIEAVPTSAAPLITDARAEPVRQSWWALVGVGARFVALAEIESNLFGGMR